MNLPHSSAGLGTAQASLVFCRYGPLTNGSSRWLELAIWALRPVDQARARQIADDDVRAQHVLGRLLIELMASLSDGFGP
ncbi:MAG: hypothetical protein ACP5H2_01180, partial [Solirubrobacteraceae bacterium]